MDRRLQTSLFGRALRPAATLAALLIIPAVLNAMPPSPSLLEARARAQAAGSLVTDIPSTAEMHARGIGLPEDCFGLRAPAKGAQPGAQALGTFRVLALMVDFSDQTSQVPSGFFDTLVFGNGSGTVHSYFDEVSYTQIDLVTLNLPSTSGWNRAPSTYAYYVNNAYAMGTYPRNSQKLVEDLVNLVDASIDFSPYDNDGDGDVDVLLVIHSGTGAELSGSTADVWSHKWGITPKMTGDGVYVSTFTIQPEFWTAPRDMTIGVYAHELLHGFNLPDLYDTDGGSNGVGKWCIMSYGSWNGSPIGSSPAHPCAWSRIELGISSAVNVTANRTAQSIPAVNGGGSIFRLWTSGAASNEYFLVENRQKTGYDSYIPGSGLLIWHIDDGKANNDQAWYPTLPGSTHALVALEQADGLFELEHQNDQGDAGDCWPGSMSRTTFNGTSTPSSDAYLTGGTFVGVTNISASAATMTANLIVGIAADVEDPDELLPTEFSLSQNYPNPFNPTTSISFGLAEASEITLEVVNVLGQHVRTLYEGPAVSGQTTVTWDSLDDNGDPVASGVYFYRLSASGHDSAKKMMLIK
jgi:immune inhibitor A